MVDFMALFYHKIYQKQTISLFQYEMSLKGERVSTMK